MADLVPLMNATKWNELRIVMSQLEDPPQWRTRDVENGYVTDWDREWFHHFRNGGYETIEWVEIRTGSAEHHHAVKSQLSRIHLPGTELASGFQIVGWLPAGAPVEYIV